MSLHPRKNCNDIIKSEQNDNKNKAQEVEINEWKYFANF